MDKDTASSILSQLTHFFEGNFSVKGYLRAMDRVPAAKFAMDQGFIAILGMGAQRRSKALAFILGSVHGTDLAVLE
ncbi:MAG: hypothetical protein Q9166_006019 [cf. Caloplaca sp. 2 TL-2023]